MSQNENNEFKEHLRNIIDKGSDDFEKYIMIIATGTIVLSLNMFVNIENEKICVHYFIIGIVVFFISIISILVNHLISIYLNGKTLNETEKDQYSENKRKCRNRIITFINVASIFLIVVGFIFIILFIHHNFNNSFN